MFVLFFTFNHTFQFAQILHSIHIVPIRKIKSNTNNNNSIKPAPPSHANKRLRKCGVSALRNMHAAMYNFDDFIYNLFKLNCLNLGVNLHSIRRTKKSGSNEGKIVLNIFCNIKYIFLSHENKSP